MTMPHWPFVIGAYIFAGLALGGLLVQSWRAMRRAERDLDAMRRADRT